MLKLQTATDDTPLKCFCVYQFLSSCYSRWCISRKAFKRHLYVLMFMVRVWCLCTCPFRAIFTLFSFQPPPSSNHHSYPVEMDELMAHNPGVRSRFPTVILFEDYNPDELMAIAEGILKKQHLTATEGGLAALRAKLQTMVDAPDVQVKALTGYGSGSY